MKEKIDDIPEAPPPGFAEQQEKYARLIEQVRCDEVEKVGFTGMMDYERPTQQNIDDLIEALDGNSSTKQLRFFRAPIGASNMAKLAPVIAAHPALENISFKECELDDAAMKMLGDAIAGHPTVHTLVVDNERELTYDGFMAAAPIIEQSPEFAMLCFEPNDPVLRDRMGDAIQDLTDLAVASGNKNIILWPVADGKGAAQGNRNRTAATYLGDELGTCEPENMPLTTMLQLAVRRNLIKSYNEFEPVIAEKFSDFDEYVATMPTIDLEGDFSWEDLTKRNDNGHAPLDNPLIGKQFHRIAAKLAEKGTPITPEQLAQTNRDGDPYLTVAIASALSEDAIHELNQSGYAVSLEQLVGKDGFPTGLMHVAAMDCPDQLFSKENWKLQSSQSLRETLAAIRHLPDDVQQDLPSYHALLHNITRYESHAQRER